VLAVVYTVDKQPVTCVVTQHLALVVFLIRVGFPGSAVYEQPFIGRYSRFDGVAAFYHQFVYQNGVHILGD
jgi:hypothetical protein